MLSALANNFVANLHDVRFVLVGLVLNSLTIVNQRVTWSEIHLEGKLFRATRLWAFPDRGSCKQP